MKLFNRNFFQFSSKSLFLGKGILIFFVLQPHFTSAQCTNAPYGMAPSLNVTPNCSGSLQTITTQAKAGEYSNVVVFPDIEYTFSSSRVFDYITITSENGTTVLAHGTTPISWNTNNFSGIIRYYLHNNSACQIDATARTKYINCNSFPEILCYEPQNLQVGNIDTNSALFYWNDVNPLPGQGYHYYFSEEDTPPVATTIPTGVIAGTSVLFEDLNPNTTYYCWVRSSCFYDLQTDWVGINFTTSAGCNPSGNTLFPTATFTPTCSGNDQVITNSARAGQYSNVSISSNRLYTFRSSNTNDQITITNSSGTLIYKTGQTPLNWLSGSNSGTIRYYLHKNNNCDSEAVNRTRFIKCSATSQDCVSPNSISVTDITNQQATLFWNIPIPIPGNGYEIYRSTNSTPPSLFSQPIFTTEESIITLTGLNPNATYYTWVRAVCDNGNKGAWTQGQTFTTLSNYSCPSPTAIQADIISSYHAKLSWNTNGIQPHQGFEYYFSMTNNAPSGSTPPTGSLNEAVLYLNNLTPSTNYYVWIRSACSSTGKSSWMAFPFVTNSSPFGCTTHLNITPQNLYFPTNCDGNEYVMTTTANSASYGKVRVIPNKHYTFRSTVNSDFITITNENGTIIYKSGLTPLHWNSSNVVETIRFYNHTNSACSNANNFNRTKTVKCDDDLFLSLPENSVPLETIIYPNPGESTVSIESNDVIQTVEFFNLLGQRVKEYKNVNELNININTATLQLGTYLIKVTTETSQKTIKWVKN
ncbi:fibronectin type III domain-containing protein [Flavobacterium sp.]|uniref:fibronectin type III domain-containing protein n=1 Tax=Flavobacterium sp. TaxID=239 RepID=UPI0035298EC2